MDPSLIPCCFHLLLGLQFDAVFVCTAQPVNQDYSPFDPVKSMCDRYMFNTIITRPKSLLVVIGNPFRLRKIEQTTPDHPACWSEYLSSMLGMTIGLSQGLVGMALYPSSLHSKHNPEICSSLTTTTCFFSSNFQPLPWTAASLESPL